MDLPANSYTSTDIPLENENISPVLRNAVSEYLNGNSEAFLSIPNGLHMIMNNTSRSLRMKLFLKSCEYEDRLDLNFMSQKSGMNLFLIGRFKVIRRERWQDFLQILEEMRQIKVLDDSYNFIKNYNEAHNQLIAGIFAVLFTDDYTLKKDANGKRMSESSIIKSLFNDIKAPIHIDNYLRKESKQSNMKLAYKKLPTMIQIAIKRNQNYTHK